MRRLTGLMVVGAAVVLMTAGPGWAQSGAVLTRIDEAVQEATQDWESTVMAAARSLFWLLAGIELGLAAIWLALSGGTLESFFADMVRRVMFIGFFVFVLEQGPDFAEAVVDSLFSLGAESGSASPAEVFNAGLRVAARLSQDVRFGLFEDNALSIAAVFAMVVVVVCFALVAAIFVAAMVEMYVGLLAGLIMLGLGGSSFTKDFAIRYLVYAFSVGLKLMALVMIARIGSDVLLDMADIEGGEDRFLTTLAIGGVAVVVFMISAYVPAIMQGVVQGASVSTGAETLRPTLAAGQFGAGAATMGASVSGAGWRGAQQGYADGGIWGAAKGATSGMAKAASQGTRATGSAIADKAVGVPGSRGSSVMGLANAKLDGAQTSERKGRP